jgi:hypothetical protein
MEKETFINLLKTINESVLKESHFSPETEKHENSIYSELEKNELNLPDEALSKARRLHDLALMAKENDYTGDYQHSDHYKRLSPQGQEQDLVIYPEKIYDELISTIHPHVSEDHPVISKMKKEKDVAKRANYSWHKDPSQ